MDLLSHVRHFADWSEKEVTFFDKYYSAYVKYLLNIWWLGKLNVDVKSIMFKTLLRFKGRVAELLVEGVLTSMHPQYLFEIFH